LFIPNSGLYDNDSDKQIDNSDHLFYNECMDALERLKLLSSQMKLEPAEDLDIPEMGPCTHLTAAKQDAVVVSHAVMPNGQRIKLLKTLLTSVCERNCYYCPFRAGRDFRRATFRPEEFARTFMLLHQKDIAEGVFLSSGVINGGVQTQDQLIATAEVLRNKLGFRGYIHLKIMPGAEYAQVERAMELADRVSINLEAPNSARLEKLAPLKQFTEELLQPLRWVEDIRRTQPRYKGWNGHWPSSVTQFVVGAVGDSDLELMHTTEYLYRRLRLTRTYFSAFNPIPNTPLEDVPPTSPRREQRLYQASFLLRDYGFGLEDLPFDGVQNLPLDTDPKLAWAKVNLTEPVEVNRADRHELLRVPGIGPRIADKILKARREGKLHDISSLAKMGPSARRAAPFILLDGKRPAYQRSLW
jgi:predicted DNA-binding helix-hairpin-helix protein